MGDGEYIKKKRERERKILDNVTKFSTLFIIRLAPITGIIKLCKNWRRNFINLTRQILFIPGGIEYISRNFISFTSLSRINNSKHDINSTPYDCTPKKEFSHRRNDVCISTGMSFLHYPTRKRSGFSLTKNVCPLSRVHYITLYHESVYIARWIKQGFFLPVLLFSSPAAGQQITPR